MQKIAASEIKWNCFLFNGRDGRNGAKINAMFVLENTRKKIIKKMIFSLSVLI